MYYATGRAGRFGCRGAARAGQGRETMERCPHCGSPSREGAKFCTTCGYRFSGMDDEAQPSPVEEGTGAGQANDELTQETASPVVAWPAPPSEEPSPASPWARCETAADANLETADEASATTWPQAPSTFWSQSTDAPPAVESSDEGTQATSEPVALPEVASVPHADAVAALARATGLLDDLREAFAQLGQAAAPNLSGVISDLEVAATPPGALDPVELASLRDALLSARERPRDIDTILDLSQRIDVVIALMIAYDRAIAAIERSLAVLRRE